MRFLLVDRVRELELGRRIVAVKNVTLESDYFGHHFPRLPIFPGTLVVEAMAQSAGYLLWRSVEQAEGRRVLPVLTGIRGARFLRTVGAGDQLLIEARLTAQDFHVAQAQVTAHVESELVARAELGFGMRHYKNQEQYAAAVQQMDMLARVLERGAADLPGEDLQ
jgi:3-hydroxymyristoyl/3-hydroxydecanoyl-(acyl carrier protein) dehydratase